MIKKYDSNGFVKFKNNELIYSKLIKHHRQEQMESNEKLEIRHYHIQHLTRPKLLRMINKSPERKPVPFNWMMEDGNIVINVSPHFIEKEEKKKIIEDDRQLIEIFHQHYFSITLILFVIWFSYLLYIFLTNHLTTSLMKENGINEEIIKEIETNNLLSITSPLPTTATSANSHQLNNLQDTKDTLSNMILRQFMNFIFEKIWLIIKLILLITVKINNNNFYSNIILMQYDSKKYKDLKKTNLPPIPLISLIAVQSNSAALDWSRSATAAVAGAFSGILGLSTIYGFMVYFLSFFLLSFLIILNLSEFGTNKDRVIQSFGSYSSIITSGLFSGIFTFLLCWTFTFENNNELNNKEEEEEEEEEEEKMILFHDLSKDEKLTIDKIDDTGVIYLSRVPRLITIGAIRELFGEYGALGRVYLQRRSTNKYHNSTRALDNLIGESMKKFKKNNKRDKSMKHVAEYEEGWIEYLDKKNAELAISLMNGKKIGGKRRRAPWYDDVWSMKYLPSFKWSHLNESMEGERFDYKKRLTRHVGKARMDADLYIKQAKYEISKSSRNKKVESS
ncbi:hypothetical protein SNEBB_006606 [Seison nebaliae]|nr:hypothetical protein SNEBB_006606 [Seison nebaliae]